MAEAAGKRFRKNWAAVSYVPTNRAAFGSRRRRKVQPSDFHIPLLPNALIEHIIDLSIESAVNAGNMAAVCKTWHIFAVGDYVWLRLATGQLPILEQGIIEYERDKNSRPLPFSSFRALYKAHSELMRPSTNSYVWMLMPEDEWMAMPSGWPSSLPTLMTDVTFSIQLWYVQCQWNQKGDRLLGEWRGRFDTVEDMGFRQDGSLDLDWPTSAELASFRACLWTDATAPWELDKDLNLPCNVEDSEEQWDAIELQVYASCGLLTRKLYVGQFEDGFNFVQNTVLDLQLQHDKFDLTDIGFEPSLLFVENAEDDPLQGVPWAHEVHVSLNMVGYDVNAEVGPDVFRPVTNDEARTFLHLLLSPEAERIGQVEMAEEFERPRSW